MFWFTPKRDLIEFLDQFSKKKPNVYVYVDLRKRALPRWAKLDDVEGAVVSRAVVSRVAVFLSQK